MRCLLCNLKKLEIYGTWLVQHSAYRESSHWRNVATNHTVYKCRFGYVAIPTLKGYLLLYLLLFQWGLLPAFAKAEEGKVGDSSLYLQVCKLTYSLSPFTCIEKCSYIILYCMYSLCIICTFVYTIILNIQKNVHICA